MRAGIGVIAALAIGTAVGCVRFDLFACTDASECVLNGQSGRCEASGYCSFPDPDCDSGSRYSEHASPSLAHTCVDDEPVAGTGGSTGVGTTLDGSDGASDGPEGSDESGSVPVCVDNDGDGAGVGDDCDSADCDDDNPAAIDNCLYIGPDGDDANPGTRDSPWRTFDRAFQAMVPGDSLVALDGIYRQDDHGTAHVTCGGNAVSGTAAAPIFVRAENDRQAIIDRQSVAYGVRVGECEYWRVRGFSVISGDLAADEGGQWRNALSVSGSTSIEVRQLVLSHANRYFNEHLVQVAGSRDVLLEDIEAHDFFRSGFTFYSTNDSTCRRCYGNSHGATDLPNCQDVRTCPEGSAPGDLACPKCSAGDVSRGDATFYVEHSNDILLENCVSEGSHRGFHLLGGLQDDVRAGSDLRIVESVSIDDNVGLELDRNSDSIPPDGAVITDLAIVSPNDDGIRIADPDGLVLSNITILDAVEEGVVVFESSPANCVSGACSLSMDHILVRNAGESGFDIREPIDTWSLEASNAFGSGIADYIYPASDTDAVDDDAGNVRGCMSAAPTRVGLGADECRVYIPDDSNMHDVAGDGVDIGANVTNRRLEGVSTPDPLWNEEGGFPCGPQSVMPAPISGERCGDLAERVALGTAGCSAPAPRE